MSTSGRTTQALVDALAERYRLGHEEIDRQHRRIFAIVAQAEEGKPGDHLLDELLAYAGVHFSSEERLAADLGVQEAEHVEQHRRLLEVLLAYRRDPIRRGLVARQFLVEWVKEHIDRDDRELVRCMKVAITLQGRLGDGTGPA